MYPNLYYFFKDVFEMMKSTVEIYRSFLANSDIPEEQFTKDYLPVWEKLDKFGHHLLTRIGFAIFYVSIYI